MGIEPRTLVFAKGESLKEKLAQLPAVDMQLAFVHKGNLHVKCRQLIEFFFQCNQLNEEEIERM